MLSDLHELRVDPRHELFGQLDLGQPRLVEDAHRGAVLDGTLDVVGVDVVAEHGAGVLVGELDGRAGEADERGVRQRVAQVSREAVDEVVLAAVRLVGDDDDVLAVAQQRVHVALLVGHELLDGGEHDPAGGHPEPATQVVATLGLPRHLT